MKKILFICWALLVTLAIVSCKETIIGPVENDGVAPGPVSNLSVLNLNGAAKITFTAPSDEDVAYIRAKYTTRTGEVRETKVSRYKNDVTLEGFADTDPYQVVLTAVDRGENESKPVDITVNPLDPPFKIAFQTLEVQKDFGGAKINLVNLEKAKLAVVVLTNDSLSNFVPTQTFYTETKNIEFSVRGFESKERIFGIVVRDRWGNKSDTLRVNITPLFEEKLDRTKMKGLILPTDATLGYGGAYDYLFDDNVAGASHYHSGNGNRMPQWFTFDMGIKAQLSRLVYFTRPGAYFDVHAPINVEIWGSNDPNPDGSFDESWTLMTTYKNVKPSGLPLGQMSQADIAAGQEGFTIQFPLDAPKMRYMRFKVLKNWSGSNYLQIYEVRLFGDTQ